MRRNAKKKDCHPQEQRRKKTTKKTKKETEDEQEEETATFACGNVPLCGDINVSFTDKGSKLFAFWVSSSFVKDNRVVLVKEEIDKAHKDTSHKSFHEKFNVELVFSDITLPPDQAHAHAPSDAAVAAAIVAAADSVVESDGDSSSSSYSSEADNGDANSTHQQE